MLTPALPPRGIAVGGRARLVAVGAERALDVAVLAHLAVGVALGVDGRLVGLAVEALELLGADAGAHGIDAGRRVHRPRAADRAQRVGLEGVGQAGALLLDGAAQRADLGLVLAQRVDEVVPVVADRLVGRHELHRRPHHGQRGAQVAQRQQRVRVLEQVVERVEVLAEARVQRHRARQHRRADLERAVDGRQRSRQLVHRRAQPRWRGRRSRPGTGAGRGTSARRCRSWAASARWSAAGRPGPS